MVRLLTYNVHRCLGIDGILSPRRIAEVIASAQPDIVLLQELDVGRQRSGGVDQAAEIAAHLGMQLHFHAALTVMEERYGDAILTARPSRLVRAHGLPQIRRQEPRGALWASVHVAGGELNVVCTHLGLRGAERLAQVDCLLGADWIASPACRGPVVLAGDFNAVPGSRAYRRIASVLRDAQAAAAPGRPLPTFPTRLPMLRLDHVFVGAGVEVLRAGPVLMPLARLASDHLPLLAELRLAPPRAGGSHRLPPR